MAKKGKKIVKVSDNKKEKSTQGKAPQKKRVLVKTKSSAASTTIPKANYNQSLVFGKENYKWIGIGLALIALGMILMMGGFNEDPNVFDEGLIYSFRRITLAPILILAGLGVQIYAIFR